MHNDESNKPASLEEEIAALNAKLSDSAKSLEESLAASFKEMDDLVLHDVDMGPMLDIDIDMNIVFGDSSAFEELGSLAGQGIPPGNPPKLPPIAPGASGPTERITIRVPGWLLAEYKRKALDRGTKYQTLMIEILRDAALKWLANPVTSSSP